MMHPDCTIKHAIASSWGAMHRLVVLPLAAVVAALPACGSAPGGDGQDDGTGGANATGTTAGSTTTSATSATSAGGDAAGGEGAGGDAPLPLTMCAHCRLGNTLYELDTSRGHLAHRNDEVALAAISEPSLGVLVREGEAVEYFTDREADLAIALSAPDFSAPVAIWTSGTQLERMGTVIYEAIGAPGIAAARTASSTYVGARIGQGVPALLDCSGAACVELEEYTCPSPATLEDDDDPPRVVAVDRSDDGTIHFGRICEERIVVTRVASPPVVVFDEPAEGAREVAIAVHGGALHVLAILDASGARRIRLFPGDRATVTHAVDGAATPAMVAHASGVLGAFRTSWYDDSPNIVIVSCEPSAPCSFGLLQGNDLLSIGVSSPSLGVFGEAGDEPWIAWHFDQETFWGPLVVP